MATLWLDQKDLELRAEADTLIIERQGERLQRLPVALLERAVIQSKVRLDSTVLGALAEAGVATLILSPRHARRTALVLGLPHADASVRLAQYRACEDADFCLRLSRVLVRAKIQRCRIVLGHALTLRGDLRYPLTQALERLARLRQSLAEDARSIQTLRGIEGAAAAAYFAAYTQLFASELGFTERNRRPPRDPVNAVLSLAYTLLHFEAVRLAHAHGLDPSLGFFHDLAYGRESLACDLIEPVRAEVDHWVWRLFAERQLRAEHFSRDGGAVLLGKAGRAIFYQAHETATAQWSRRLRRYTRALVRILRAHTATAEHGT
ncbi:CRISP-associated protein Cas1 [Fontimonas thermophila]|uniref:CRISPR-associated endonuclease Cas1 n=1 Tax=Fontimonas thermophila TaxID=1076937 RepID=A0A1I2IYP4_9GAMM|nr:CRISPR-associated endonuclease Cas1 [Fontimonas thermophila]SFF47414.1 CRISP-associated protein Cas1 [Fontimonas thermophila]